MTSALAITGTLMLAGPAVADSHTGDLDCADFESQAAAQAEYLSDPSDPHGLDGDDDGVACESYAEYSDPARNETPVGSGTAEEDDDDQVTNVPSGGVATGGGSTSGFENQGMLAGGALALAAGAGGLILAGRREARD